METSVTRRPVEARDWRIIRKTARWLSRTSVTPNQISLASVFFSAAAAVCLIQLPVQGIATWTLSYLAVAFIGARVLCNVLDGLVAVEGGKRSASGEMFNDIPDRISDSLILVAAGYATDIVPWAAAAGWLSALLAVMTAYVRTLARGLGAVSDFRGPMAKPHRMAVIAIAFLLTPLESLVWQQGYVVLIALLVVIAGCIATIWNRARAAYLSLERRPG